MKLIMNLIAILSICTVLVVGLVLLRIGFTYAGVSDLLYDVYHYAKWYGGLLLASAFGMLFYVISTRIK